VARFRSNVFSSVRRSKQAAVDVSKSWPAWRGFILTTFVQTLSPANKVSVLVNKRAVREVQDLNQSQSLVWTIEAKSKSIVWKAENDWLDDWF